MAVLRGHNGLMLLAAKGAHACLLLEQAVAASFAIQLLAASKDEIIVIIINKNYGWHKNQRPLFGIPAFRFHSRTTVGKGFPSDIHQPVSNYHKTIEP